MRSGVLHPQGRECKRKKALDSQSRLCSARPHEDVEAALGFQPQAAPTIRCCQSISTYSPHEGGLLSAEHYESRRQA